LSIVSAESTDFYTVIRVR